MNVKEAAERWNLSERRVRVLCANGQIDGAFRRGKLWIIPDGAEKPADGRIKAKATLLELIAQKKAALDKCRPLTEGEVQRLYEDFMIEYTYNSNAIEGNTLTLRETNMVLRGVTIDKKPLKDHMEAVGHKEAFWYICDLVKDKAEFLYYGGWDHLNVCKMKADMKGFVGGTMKEITPKDYVEAPFVCKTPTGKYLLMYSSGAWGFGSYCVKTAYADSPFGPFEGSDTVLSASVLADGPGHNSAFIFNGKRYVAYHRRIIGDANWHHRQLCIDEMQMENGKVIPIVMT